MLLWEKDEWSQNNLADRRCDPDHGSWNDIQRKAGLIGRQGLAYQPPSIHGNDGAVDIV